MIDINILATDLAVAERHWATLSVGLKEMVRRSVAVAGASTQGIAKRHTPVKTGRLRGSISLTLTPTTALISTEVPYAEWVHGGTGIYGPSRTPITPKHKSIMASKTNPGWGTRSKGGYYIIGRSQKGQKPNPFMERAAEEAKPLIFKEFQTMVKTLASELGAG